MNGDQSLAIGFVRGSNDENDRLERFVPNVQKDVQSRIKDTVGASPNFVVLDQDQMSGIRFTELEEMHRQGKVHVQRIISDSQLGQRASTMDEPEHEIRNFHQPDRPLKLGALKSGLLHSLKFIDDDMAVRSPLHEDEIEISVQAIGVNSNDVMVAYGLLKPTISECSGIVTAVGLNFKSQYKVENHVCGMSFAPYASLTRTNGHLLHRLPASITHSTAASIPIAYATAYHSLVEVAKLTSDQTILIHVADSPLGQAAVAVAQHIGAAVFVTVESESGTSLVNGRNGILESHIFDRRSNQFKRKIMNQTHVGVDIVFNPMSDDALRGSMECVAPFGTIICVGEAQSSLQRPANSDPLGRNIAWESIDMDDLARNKPQAVQTLLQTVLRHFEVGDYSSWPTTVIPLPDIGNAFRMTQAGNIFPKIVLDAGPDVRVSAVTRPSRLESDAIYVVFGRLGNLNEELCEFLRICGARHVVVLSEKVFNAEVRASIEQEMATKQLSVKVISDDEISVRGIVENLHSTLA